MFSTQTLSLVGILTCLSVTKAVEGEFPTVTRLILGEAMAAQRYEDGKQLFEPGFEYTYKGSNTESKDFYLIVFDYSKDTGNKLKDIKTGGSVKLEEDLNLDVVKLNASCHVQGKATSDKLVKYSITPGTDPKDTVLRGLDSDKGLSRIWCDKDYSKIIDDIHPIKIDSDNDLEPLA